MFMVAGFSAEITNRRTNFSCHLCCSALSALPAPSAYYYIKQTGRMFVHSKYYSEISEGAVFSATIFGLPHSEQNLPVLAQPQEHTHCSSVFLLPFFMSLQRDLITLFVNANILSAIFPNKPKIQKTAEIGYRKIARVSVNTIAIT